MILLIQLIQSLKDYLKGIPVVGPCLQKIKRQLNSLLWQHQNGQMIQALEFVNIGNTLIQQSKISEALTNYNKVIALQPEWKEAYFYRGNALQAKGDYHQALADYAQAIALKLNWDDLYCNCCLAIASGIKKLTSQELNTWRETLSSLLTAYPDNQWLILGLSHLEAVQAKDKPLSQIYEKATTLNPENPELYCQISRVMESLERWDEAIQTYQQALTLTPQNPYIYLTLGGLYLRQRQNQQALEYYQKAIILKPDCLDAYKQAGISLFLAGKMDEAVEPWSQGLEVQRNLAKSHDLDKLGIRFVGRSWLLAIGHIAMLDVYVKTGLLGWRTAPKTYLILPPEESIPNRSYLNSWQPYITFLEDDSQSPIEPNLSQYLTDEFWCAILPSGQTKIYYRWAAEVQQEWDAQQRPPLLSLSAADEARGWETLEKLGLPRDAWFVCLHVREPGFHQKWNQTYVATRDADIDTYSLGIQTIVDRGGWVIRVGDPTMKPLLPQKQVIDYAHSNLKSQWLDIFLCAKCHFFIGTNSGLGIIPSTFGIPCLFTNWTPLAVRPHYGQDLFIPKLCWSQEEQRYLSFTEMITPPFGYAQFVNDFEGKGISLMDNTPEDIAAAVQEMLERKVENLSYTETDNHLQEQFDRVVLQAGSHSGSRIGRDFLAKYADLLTPKS